MGLLNIIKRPKITAENDFVSSLPPLEDPFTMPTCIDDLKEWHYKVLKKLDKHAEKEQLSGIITLEVDIPKFIVVAMKLKLIDLAYYNDALHYLNNQALKSILKKHGLKVSGNKQQMIDRILSNIDEMNVRSSDEYSDFYILTDIGHELVDNLYVRFKNERIKFFKHAIDLIMNDKIDEAYRMICKYNAERPIPPGIGYDWKKRYYNRIIEFKDIYQQQMRLSNNKLITAAAIYCNISGNSINNIKNYLEDAFSFENDVTGSLSYAISLLYSEINYSNANMLGVKKYRFVATLDARTCPICGKLDGKDFILSEKRIGVNYPPIHDGCRCTIIPVIDGYISGKRRARNPITNESELIPYISYSDWIKKFK